MERIFEHSPLISVEPLENSPFPAVTGVSYYRITADFEKPTVPEKYRVSWRERFDDGYSVFTPDGGFDHAIRPSWRPIGTNSRSASGAPLIGIVSSSGKNTAMIALSDAVTPMRLTAGFEEPSQKSLFTIDLFTIRTEPITHYETLLRIDVSDRPFYECVRDARRWWTATGYVPAHVPDAAKRSMFSSWYCFQEDVDEERLFRQCLIAKEDGMDTVLLDDGWQTDEERKVGYLSCGDWEPASTKFPDMRRFADRLHGIGMKIILWYAVPFVSRTSKSYERFRDFYLRRNDRDGKVMILDPRFPEVRDRLSDLYRTAVRDWALDGLKLDFIDCFSLGQESPADDPGMDCPFLEAAVDKLLAEITAAVREVNPDIMIEFRQSYTGPAMQKYGNMLRVGDCAAGALINRVNVLTLRLLTSGTAVHSDRLLWDYDAKPESAADQLSNILFAVPQISVMPDRLSAEHRVMLRQYLRFMDDNRDLLLDGDLVPLCPEANYPQAYAVKEGRVIAALYENPFFRIPAGCSKLTVVNACAGEDIILDMTDAPELKQWAVTDCMGNPVSDGRICNTTLVKIAVPHNGFLTVQP